MATPELSLDPHDEAGEPPARPDHMSYAGVSPRKEKTMARSTLVSPSEADKQYA